MPDRHAKKFMSVSTAHITNNDDELLRADAGPFSILKKDGGWVVETHGEEGELRMLTIRSLILDGFSDAYIGLIRVAIEDGYDGLWLDCDGPEYPDLPSFTW